MAKRSPNIRNLARRQRWMIWLVLMVIVAQFLPFLGHIPALQQFGVAIVLVGACLQIVFYLVSVVGVILLLTAQGNHPIIVILTGLVMLAPCGNLLVLVLVNQSITRTLKRAGLRVRLMGVDPVQLERLLNAELCRRCGYNLTGNVTGICPECGSPLTCRSCGCRLQPGFSGNCPNCGQAVRMDPVG